MQTPETEEQPITKARMSAPFRAVFDSRNRRIRGLWKRGDRYYAQLRVDIGNGRRSPRRFALNASDLVNARAELERKRTERRDDRLPLHTRKPTLEQCTAEYLSDSPMFAQKKRRTQESERQAIARWIKSLGLVRVNEISLKKIDDYRRARLRESVSPRTINLDVIALRQVLTYAKVCGYIENIIQFFAPKRGGSLKALTERCGAKRQLLTKEQFAALIAAGAAYAVLKNSAELCFYLRFLALTGAREKEALGVARRDVDFARRLVTIGADGNSKNSRSRTVNFSPELETLLREIEAWLPPDTSWLFPSPQRGPSKDIHAESLRESFKLVRKKAGLEWVGFHDLRHFFASECVMAAIDFMTIASWLGHQDGGILVGKVYGHLADSHKRAAAQKLRFFKK
jgi:integrase